MGEAGVRQRRKAERPAMIIAAALAEFSLHGFAGTRLDDVAARAGITKGTIYVYFPSKEDLFIATLKEMTRPMIDNLRVLAADPDGSALDILRRHLTFVAERMVEDRCGRDIYRILIAEGHRFPSVVEGWFTEVMEPVMQALTTIVRRGTERGEFRASAVDDFPQVIMAPIFLHHNWNVLFGDSHPIKVLPFFEAAIDLIAHGLLPR